MISKRYVIIAGALIFIIIGLAFFSNNYYQAKGAAELKPNFTVEIKNCTLDSTEQGILSFSFDINVTKNRNRLPSQIVFQIIDFTKNYSFHKYMFYHGVNLTREYKFDRIYHENETIRNVSVIIDNIYRDYMYLPSEYFNYQLYYCEYNENELNELKSSKRIFKVLDNECLLFFDFETAFQDHMYSINQHPGIQCNYIPRFA